MQEGNLSERDSLNSTFDVNCSLDVCLADFGNAWGRLAFLNGFPSGEPNLNGSRTVDLTENIITLGRKEGMTLVFEDIRISGNHCTISRTHHPDSGNYEVHIRDESTNGTFVNGKKVGKGNSVSIRNGDQINLVGPSTDSKCISFLFQDLLQLHKLESNYSLENSLTENSPANECIDGENPKGFKRKDNLETISNTTTWSKTQPTKKPKFDDSIAVQLICSICQDLFYKAVTLIPCMHNFCQCCFSDWMKRGNSCPQCRGKVSSVRRNFVLANLVESYLLENPEKRRDSQELDAMDKRCTITDKMLNSKRKLPCHTEEDDSEFSDSSESEESSEENSSVDDTSNSRSSIGFAGVDIRRCKECQNYGPDGLQCEPCKNHLACSACHELFPDRTAENPNIPTKCEHCQKLFCGQYWPCLLKDDIGAFKPLNSYIMLFLSL